MEASSAKQKLLLDYLISSADTFALCKSIIKSQYFNPEYRKAVDFIHEYYDKYNSTPNKDQVYAETGTELQERVITRGEIEYCSEEVASFCRRKAVEGVIYGAPKKLSSGDYGDVERELREAIAISLNKDMGIDYFNNPAERLEQAALEPPRTPTKWKKIDEALFGGLARTEMMLFSANSGGGKSITLANLALNFVSQKLNVLYITLELSEKLVSQRFDTMFTGVPSVRWQQELQETAASLNVIAPHMGKLVIKHMHSGTNANAIRGYLKEFELKHGYVPDLLIVDYLDIMGANEQVSADNVWEKDKRATEQLRDIGIDYNMFIATASQQNRAALEAEHLHQGHIAGGISKVNTVDIHVSIILNPTMKAAGEIGFFFMKTRNSDGVGKTIYLKWDNSQLRILNPTEDLDVDDDGVIIEKIASSNSAAKKKSLKDLLNI